MVRVFGSDPDALESDLALLSHAGMTVQAVTDSKGNRLAVRTRS
jgi:hypothetical protein